LGLTLIPAILKNPMLIRSIFTRSKLSSADQTDDAFIVFSGARLEYWGWHPDAKLIMGAVELLKSWLTIAKALGFKRVVHEVDAKNQKSYELHLLLGSKVKRSFFTPDSRERYLMEYLLE
jgi:hypothetical protein